MTVTWHVNKVNHPFVKGESKGCGYLDIASDRAHSILLRSDLKSETFVFSELRQNDHRLIG